MLLAPQTERSRGFASHQPSCRFHERLCLKGILHRKLKITNLLLCLFLCQIFQDITYHVLFGMLQFHQANHNVLLIHSTPWQSLLLSSPHTPCLRPPKPWRTFLPSRLFCSAQAVGISINQLWITWGTRFS